MAAPIRQVDSATTTGINPLESKNTDLNLLIKEYIDKGLTLIQEGKYKEAIKYFQSKDMATKLGYKLLVQRLRPIRYPKTRNEFLEHLELISHFSGVSVKRKEIELLTTGIDDNYLEVNQLKSFFDLEIALVHAEEWLHVLEKINAWKPISRNGKKIQFYCTANQIKCSHEIEVADYFLEKGISWELLQNTQWIKRYNREQVLRALRFW